jgi:hypothetical protein
LRSQGQLLVQPVLVGAELRLHAPGDFGLASLMLWQALALPGSSARRLLAPATRYWPQKRKRHAKVFTLDEPVMLMQAVQYEIIVHALL